MDKLSKEPELYSSECQKEWDQYWAAEEQKKKRLYDAIAVFYRKYIIKPALNHYMKKEFAQGSLLLHAGCGPGQVDTDILRWARITALDLSFKALERYCALHGNTATLSHGSIFELPFEKESFDGIYNLGVMEHFTREEIIKILNEFHRVLKQRGKIVLFWPPKFGLSVRALTAAHVVLNRWFKKNIKLYPDEITLVLSRAHVEGMLSEAHFELTQYHFGVRDLFTYTIVVGHKIPANQI